MNEPPIENLLQFIHDLNNARRVRNYDKIAASYDQIASVVGGIYAIRNATTALVVEGALIAGEQNGINKTQNTHRAISLHLRRIGKAQEADIAQSKNPRKYHGAAFLDHADKYFKDGTANDSVRVALAECRKRLKYLITAMGAEDNEPKRQCNILRHAGLLDAERDYIERQVEYQEKYDSAEEKNLARKDSLQSFDAKMRRELREIDMTPAPEEDFEE